MMMKIDHKAGLGETEKRSSKHNPKQKKRKAYWLGLAKLQTEVEWAIHIRKG
jgi:hypothetical protein